MRSLSSGFPTRSDTTWAVQPMRMARAFKLWIYKVEGLFYLYSEKTKALVNCVATTKLICALFFVYILNR